MVFLHPHGGTRLDGLFLKPHVLPKAAFCLFDFAGSGLSEGEFVSLGPKEMRDAKQVIDHIRASFGIGNVVVWGRSMGAVAAILLAERFEGEVQGLVLDSPFSDLTVMVDSADEVKDFVTSKKPVPRCLIGCLLACFAFTVKKKTGTKIDLIKPVDSIKRVRVPIFIFVAKADVLAKPIRVKNIFDSCPSSEKVFFLVEGEHTSVRDAVVVSRAVIFLFKRFLLETYKSEAARPRQMDRSPPDLRRPDSAGPSSTAASSKLAVHKLSETDLSLRIEAVLFGSNEERQAFPAGSSSPFRGAQLAHSHVLSRELQPAEASVRGTPVKHHVATYSKLSLSTPEYCSKSPTSSSEKSRTLLDNKIELRE